MNADPVAEIPMPIAYARHMMGQKVACAAAPTSSNVRIEAMETVPPTQSEKKNEAIEAI